jgi:choline dehydrogenase
VLLAGGAIHSPQLLELSGIGDAKVLNAAGIVPRHDLPQVGEELQDHLQFRMIYRLQGARTANARAGTGLGRALMLAQWALLRTGPLAGAPAQLGFFVKSDPRKAMPDLQYLIVPYSSDRMGAPPHPFPGITVSFCQLQPDSRGSVHVRDPHLATPPAIRLGYLTAETDRQAFLAGVRLTRRVMAAGPLARYAPEEKSPGAACASDEAILAAVRAGALSIYHPTSSCRMGAKGRAVVDPRLRVHGLSGLRVVDASVMPQVVSANTNAATIMIAEKGAAMILEDRRR